jgi:predicted esterase
MSEHLGFVHIHQPAIAPGRPTFLALHGTGGTEDDLLPLARMLDPDAGVLSPRGKVLERGMPRFFRRLAEGVFDLADLTFRTSELAAFVRGASDHYQFDASRVIAVGFSNGANIAASMLLLHPEVLHAAILFSPMVPVEPPDPPKLAGIGVFISAGRSDPIVDPGNTQRLADMLGHAGAAVTLHWKDGGHELSRSDVDASRAWYQSHGLASK